MNSATKLCFAVASVVAIATLSVAWQFPQWKEVEARHAELLKRNATLQKETVRFQAELQASGADGAHAAAETVGGKWNDTDYIPVKFGVLKEVQFQVLESKNWPDKTRQPPPDWSPHPLGQGFPLSTQALGLLALSPTEAHDLQDVFAKYEDRVQAYQRANLRLLTREEAIKASGEYMGQVSPIPSEAGQSAPDGVNVFSLAEALGELDRSYPNPPNIENIGNGASTDTGRQTAYIIPALSETEATTTQKWLFDQIVDAIGPDRTEILWGKIIYDGTFYLRKDTSVLIGFVDRGDPSIGPISTNWAYVFFHGDLPESRLGGASSSPVPENLAYLFQATADDPATRQPIAP